MLYVTYIQSVLYVVENKCFSIGLFVFMRNVEFLSGF